MMYYFWWDKPLGVKKPIKVYLHLPSIPVSIIQWDYMRYLLLKEVQADFASSVSSSLRPSILQKFFNSIRQLQSSISQPRASLQPRLVQKLLLSSLRSISQLRISLWPNLVRKSLSSSLRQMQSSISRFPRNLHFLVSDWYRAPATLLFSITSTTYISDPACVPTFYAPEDEDDLETLVLTVLPFVAIIFGALHLIAWQFYFPSHVEQMLWRVGSLAITILPSVALAARILYRILPRFVILFLSPKPFFFTLRNRYRESVEFFAELFQNPGLTAYVLARILLITQAVVLLRKQPESAFYTTKWSYYFPHI